MKEIILHKLEREAQERGFEVLLAVESGARMWKLDSEDSDYDIRFIFKRKLPDYLGLGKTDRGVNFKIAYLALDFQGYDIYKALKLLRVSNPTLLEWLRSRMVYIGTFSPLIAEMRGFGISMYNPTTLFNAYLSMSKNNYFKYIAANKPEKTTAKRYLYAFRGLFNALFIYSMARLPTLRFYKDMEYSDFLPEFVRHFFMEEIIPKKWGGHGNEPMRRVRRIDEWLETMFAVSECARTRSRIMTTDQFNRRFGDLLIKEIEK